ncbi:hypothetical protein NW755_005516 [Fusarium falciforme]|uniref:Major facilitator superfamily (MFS) profile domain-containing protein n=1 Tax=Fusarium falciforme TaxID=195108 RepID=A0A9W8V185_9HYPO|nr:hypothetical protein NW755_005516 [Fusarium falciforme]
MGRIAWGRDDRALAALNGLGYTGEHGRMELAQILTTLEEMKKETEGVTYMVCFRKSNLRRTLLTIAPFWIYTFTGISFVAGYFTYYFQLAGYSAQMSFRLQIAQPVLSIVGKLMAAAIIEKVGRRDLTFWGLLVLTIFLMITGGLGAGSTQPMIQGTVAFILIFSWWFNVSIGSSVFSLISEISEISTPRLRVKTIAIASASQSLVNVMWQWTIPYMFNPDKANMCAKIAFAFGGSLLCVPALSLVLSARDRRKVISGAG